LKHPISFSGGPPAVSCAFILADAIAAGLIEINRRAVHATLRAPMRSG
jgi:hypothetical protein